MNIEDMNISDEDKKDMKDIYELAEKLQKAVDKFIGINELGVGVTTGNKLRKALSALNAVTGNHICNMGKIFSENGDGKEEAKEFTFKFLASLVSGIESHFSSDNEEESEEIVRETTEGETVH